MAESRSSAARRRNCSTTTESICADPILVDTCGDLRSIPIARATCTRLGPRRTSEQHLQSADARVAGPLRGVCLGMEKFLR